MSFCKSVFWIESSVLVTQSVETLYLFLVGMAGLTCSIPFYIFVTGDESDNDVSLSLESFFCDFSLNHSPYRCLACKCAVQVAALLFVVVPDMFSCLGVGVLILTWNLCLIFLFCTYLFTYRYDCE